MKELLRIFLPVYFIIYFGIAFLAKSIIVARRTGKNPLVLPKDDNPYGLVGRYFKITLAAIFVYTLLFALLPKRHDIFLPIPISSSMLTYLGLAVMFIAFVWTVIAQSHMKNSWRIGIDTDSKTELITTGVFRFSRNPIFLGMLLSLLGLFMATPNAWTLIFMLVSYILIQVQIRLEEEFLLNEHGEDYKQYFNKTRRLI